MAAATMSRRDMPPQRPASFRGAIWWPLSKLDRALRQRLRLTRLGLQLAELNQRLDAPAATRPPPPPERPPQQERR